jgi:cytochrome oxidase Cu insertion factor (SCO1/SenC/PrrC family)
MMRTRLPTDLWTRPLACALLTTLLAGCAREKPLPVYGDIPSFELLDQQGHKFDRSVLEGHVWIADFIYTNCESSCPRMSSKMHSIQGATAPGVKLVSFTVDPQRDTPHALEEYGKKYSADEKRWTFLTGEPATLEMLDRDAFKLGDLNMDHSTRFVLVDQKGRVRGYYALFDGDSVSQLEKDAARLEAEKDRA